MEVSEGLINELAWQRAIMGDRAAEHAGKHWEALKRIQALEARVADLEAKLAAAVKVEGG